MEAATTKPHRIDKYILLEKIAVGGMAEVWLASSSQAGGITKFVAIKKILPHLAKDSEFIRMFKDEAAVVMNLSHSNIVSITGYYQSDATNELYLVMDFVEGRNLRQVLEKMKTSKQALKLSHIVYIIKELAAGLSHAHHSLNAATGKPLNIIHRDISPQNCMLSFHGEVKVVDFGISIAEIQRDKTEVGTLKGKFGYMSPEQAEGRQVDFRTDIFSLGIIFWELLSGERLFTGKNEMSILKKILDCDIPDLAEFVSEVNPEVERIVRKALAKNPEMRYTSASAMHRDLNRFINTYDPDFTTSDFSVFIRTLFAGEVIDARKKLIEFSKIVTELNSQPPAAAVSEAVDEDRTEIWTFNQGAKASEPAVASKKVMGEKLEIKPRSVAKAPEPEPEPGAEQEPEQAPVPGRESARSAQNDNGENNFSMIARDVLKGPSSPPADLVKNSDSFSVLKSAPQAGGQEASVILETKSALSPSREKQFAQQGKSSRSIEVTAGSQGSKTGSASGTPAGTPTVKPVAFVWPSPVVQKPADPRLVQTRPAPARPAYAPQVTLRQNSMMTSRSVTIAAFIFLLVAGAFFALRTNLITPPAESVMVKAPVVPVKVPDFLLQDETANTSSANSPMETVLFKSVPSGAEIWVNRGDGFKNTGGTTPSRVDVPAETPFQLKFRKFRYEDFEAKDLVASKLSGKFEANLLAQKIAYVDILANRTPRDVQVYVNEMHISEARLPMLRFEIPANMAVNIRIESATLGVKVEKSFNVKEGDRTTAQFAL